jgi:L-cystine uptake protein TcyP (sodium:dicarboxylate symporter family)
MEEVVLAVCAEATASGSSATLPLSVSNQTGKLSVEAADIAASVLIKLLIDK